VRLSFLKMHAAGNDYIYVDGIRRRTPSVNWSKASTILSDRHRSVGSDGVILILPSEIADFRMRIFNADGSEGDMCGNGVRCLGGYVWSNGLIDEQEFSVETRDGIVGIQVFSSGRRLAVEAVMAGPQFRLGEVPMRGPYETVAEEVPLEIVGHIIPVYGVRVGNPHCVLFVRDPWAIDVPALGPVFENHAVFPKRANVEFVQVIDRHRVRVRVWERGSGLTRSCGTGACASAVWAIRRGLCDSPVWVKMPGGKLQVRWDGEGDLRLRGAVHESFRGTVIVPRRARLSSGGECAGERSSAKE